MEQRVAESKLYILYIFIAVFSASSSITTGIAWGHWKQTLDQCIGRNCSCILYGYHTPTHFLGGDLAPCIWVTFGPLFYLLFIIGLACFHGYRVIFASKNNVTRTIPSRNAEGEIVEIHAIHKDDTSPLPRTFWIITSAFTAILTLYTLIHFAIFLDGYLSTCKQYRLMVEKIVGFGGTILPVIHGRLSCNAIFDFMDYIQPDSVTSYRQGYIDTGLDLTLGLIASCSTWVLFLISSLINIGLARQQE
ncbi:uncharacterized protein LOC108734465 [Agrilus planipennis]|uniref:Uncharacterized protein LOC108734465 n=1 Tax=Agrilus planipennis TaxID=224129 RepID=A0A1W4WN88_AGRPL|nr:uncharacterized protein LOC108734465 [Agrilus planipennis]